MKGSPINIMMPTPTSENRSVVSISPPRYSDRRNGPEKICSTIDQRRSSQKRLPETTPPVIIWNAIIPGTRNAVYQLPPVTDEEIIELNMVPRTTIVTAG